MKPTNNIKKNGKAERGTMFRLFKVCVFEFPMSVSLAHPNTGMHMCHCVMCKGEVRGSGYAGKRAPKHMLSGIFVSFLH